jgi:hypothetical protein
MYRPSTIRLSLAGIFALLCLGFALPHVFSQIPRPPFGGGGIPNRPGGVPGIPGRPPTNGGFGSGIPNRAPTGPGFGNGFTRTIITHEWYCSRCRQVLGHGATPPVVSSCPNCGAQFIGSKLESGARPPSFGTPPPGSGSGKSDWEMIGFPLDLGSEPDSSSGSSNTAGSADSDNSNDDDASQSTFRKPQSSLKTALLIIGILVGVVFVLGVTGLLVWVTMNSKTKRPTKLKRQTRKYDVSIGNKE